MSEIQQLITDKGALFTEYECMELQAHLVACKKFARKLVLQAVAEGVEESTKYRIINIISLLTDAEESLQAATDVLPSFVARATMLER